HDEDRFSQRRRFLLYAAGIGDDDVRAFHQKHKRLVIEGIDKTNPGMVAEQTLHRTQDIWIRMHRVNDLDLILRYDVDHGAADAFKTGSEIFATMAGDEDEGKISVQITELPFERRASS